ncbi:MAG: hypothetical protein RMJ66_06050 [Bacteroidia bacterium]|nr:hypothetical protein [Bacteroidia bacterium]MDW8134613.1 hypothetical protein [Bacteroidia bacterium]
MRCAASSYSILQRAFLEAPSIAVDPQLLGSNDLQDSLLGKYGVPEQRLSSLQSVALKIIQGPLIAHFGLLGQDKSGLGGGIGYHSQALTDSEGELRLGRGMSQWGAIRGLLLAEEN